jgi:hypothetical protein
MFSAAGGPGGFRLLRFVGRIEKLKDMAAEIIVPVGDYCLPQGSPAEYRGNRCYTIINSVTIRVVASAKAPLSIQFPSNMLQNHRLL